jgi:hypothetical protein
MTGAGELSMEDFFGARWYAVADPDVGGWAVATADRPTTDLGPGERCVAQFVDEAIARHIARLHNTVLAEHADVSGLAAVIAHVTPAAAPASDAVARAVLRHVFRVPVDARPDVVDQETENDLLRSILRRIGTEGNVELDEYGPGRPDKTGERFLALDYSWVDLTHAEAALFDAITTEESP